jgi:YjbE family integral membrane protein
MDLTSAAFWISVGQIILIDILLGGDNAVVIALACRRLPPELRNKGVMWGVVGAVVARIVLIFFALQLLALPYLKAVGAVLLLWIGVKLMLPEDDEGHGKLEGGTTLWSAVRTVIVADAVMSLDNVIAVAAAADGNLGLVIFGILVSVPIIVWGSKFVLVLIDRFPLVVTLGAALLGWIAGGMLLGDVVWKDWLATLPAWAPRAASAAGALFVVALGTLLARRTRARRVAAQAPSAPAVPAAAGVRRLLVPVVASSPVQALAAYLQREMARDPRLELRLLNVQLPVESGHARMFVGDEELQAFYKEEADRELAPAIAALQSLGLAHEVQRAVGHATETILHCASDIAAEAIVIGRQGESDLASALLGSIAGEVSARAGMPVTLVG